MSGRFNMDDYVDVAERIVLFREKYPEGSLQATVLRYPGEGCPFVVVEARAYRTADDERPGVGLAWEPYPGKTPFTKDSELMVCETSAWGRAIVAVGAADTKRGIASRNEIQARQAAEPPTRTRPGRGSSTEEPQPEGNVSRDSAPSGSPTPWYSDLVKEHGKEAVLSAASEITGEQVESLDSVLRPSFQARVRAQLEAQVKA